MGPMGNAPNAYCYIMTSTGAHLSVSVPKSGCAGKGDQSDSVFLFYFC